MKIESTVVKKKGNPKRSKRTIDDDESDYKESESDHENDWFDEQDSLEENKINKSVQKLNSFTYSEWKPQL